MFFLIIALKLFICGLIGLTSGKATAMWLADRYDISKEEDVDSGMSSYDVNLVIFVCFGLAAGVFVGWCWQFVEWVQSLGVGLLYVASLLAVPAVVVTVVIAGKLLKLTAAAVNLAAFGLARLPNLLVPKKCAPLPFDATAVICPKKDDEPVAIGTDFAECKKSPTQIMIEEGNL